MATVLFVDDEPAIRRAVRTWLTRKGHVVHEAGDLETARAIIHEQRIDGVFIDLWIGQQSGLELLTWIEDLDPALARRIAFVTGDIFTGSEAALGERFGHPVFTKPFELRDLEAQVAAWVRDRSDRNGRDTPARDERSDDRSATRSPAPPRS